MPIVTLMVLCVILSGCTVTTYPPAPPPDGSATCESVCARDVEINCGLGPNCVEDCHDADRREREIGKRLPLACMTTAATCTERDQCR